MHSTGTGQRALAFPRARAGLGARAQGAQVGWIWWWGRAGLPEALLPGRARWDCAAANLRCG